MTPSLYKFLRTQKVKGLPSCLRSIKVYEGGGKGVVVLCFLFIFTVLIVVFIGSSVSTPTLSKPPTSLHFFEALPSFS